MESATEERLLAAIEELREETRRINSRVIFQDSIEIGTASKGGGIKVYFNADDPEGAVRRVQNAVNLRDETNAMIAVSRTVMGDLATGKAKLL